MDMKKCAAIPHNMYIWDLRKYNTGSYTIIIFLSKNHKHERPKDVLAKFKTCHSKWYHKICNQTFSYRFIVAAILDEKSNIFLC